MRAFIAATTLVLVTTSAIQAQVPLSNYADSKGYIDVQELTCAQLAGTFQEDADFLGVWYSGWSNGLGKKRAINMPRVQEGIHEMIGHCKGEPEEGDRPGNRFRSEGR